jgi:RNA polymerase sigma-70 factor (ECF subfamily)
MHADDIQTAGELRLRQFLEQEAEALLGTLRFYVLRAGLATTPPSVDTAARELLNDVTVEALAHSDRFRPEGQPRAWLLGIAANLIKRRQANLAKRQRREPLARDLNIAGSDALSDDELFDRLAALSRDDLSERLEEEEQVTAMLAHLSPADREVIRLAVLLELDGRALAKALDINPGAARVRLHRALRRLRETLQVNAGSEQR